MPYFYKPHQNEPIEDNELESWPDEINTRFRNFQPNFKNMVPKTNVILLTATTLIMSLCFGVIIGYFGHSSHHSGSHCHSDALTLLTYDGHDLVNTKIIELTNSSQIKEYLKKLTDKIHIAGSQINYNLAQYIHGQWRNFFGDDNVEIKEYNVLLSQSIKNKPSKVSVVDSSGHSFWTSHLYEKPLIDKEHQSNDYSPFNAYSPSGIVLGDLVFANYGTMDDFLFLKNMNIDLTQKIAIVKYGLIFRGKKVSNAKYFNVSAVILYNDPADVTSKDENSVFPNSKWMPPSGVQRGTLFNGIGDPLTPGYPSNDYMPRLNSSQADLPTIPCIPISYEDAEELFSYLGGSVAPSKWAGRLNVTYRLGPGFNLPHHEGWKTHVEVNMETQEKSIFNVLAHIRGTLEPDRYIIIGNHRDAWTFGGLDPSSGTACLLELSRVFSQLLKLGWKPRRSIIFASWDAEEYGLLGSTEYVEEEVRILRDRAVAYLNVDVSVVGNYTIRVKSSPLLHDVIFESAKLVPNPHKNEEAKSLYDSWMFKLPPEFSLYEHHAHTEPGNKEEKRPLILPMGSSSDFVPFLNQAGVSSLDLRYTHKDSMEASSYPLYHTLHDGFFLVSKYVDPDFRLHTSITQFWGEIARRLTDDYLLPLSPNCYAKYLQKSLRLLQLKYGVFLSDIKVDLGLLESSVKNFVVKVQEFEEKIKQVDKHNPMLMRGVNDRLMLLERSFLDPNGIPGQKLLKHLILAPPIYESTHLSFPGLVDQIYVLSKELKLHSWNKESLKQHLAILSFTINAAGSALSDYM